MSDVREVSEWHKVDNSLRRRRELVNLTKPELVSRVVELEDDLEKLNLAFEMGQFT